MRIDITPMGKPRMTRRDKWTDTKKRVGRPAVLNYFDYGDELRLKLPRYEVPATLQIIFAIPMPASWSKKKREAMQGQPHQQKPDIDNLVKAFLDHLCEDDSYVWDIRAAKVWSEEGSITLVE